MTAPHAAADAITCAGWPRPRMEHFWSRAVRRGHRGSTRHDHGSAESRPFPRAERGLRRLAVASFVRPYPRRGCRRLELPDKWKTPTGSVQTTGQGFPQTFELELRPSHDPQTYFGERPRRNVKRCSVSNPFIAYPPAVHDIPPDLRVEFAPQPAGVRIERARAP
jgi:hypothetical protein